MCKLSKKEFMEKYNYAPSTYQRRMKVLKNTEIFRDAYEVITAKEISINIEIYEDFRSFLAYNRNRTRKISPKEFLKLKEERR